eukprot:2225101-Amphidinium_carterae.1
MRSVPPTSPIQSRMEAELVTMDNNANKLDFQDNDEKKGEKMMRKMTIKLPAPTQFDARHPQFYEWAGEVKTYLSIHNVHIEDIMDDNT